MKSNTWIVRSITSALASILLASGLTHATPVGASPLGEQQCVPEALLPYMVAAGETAYLRALEQALLTGGPLPADPTLPLLTITICPSVVSSVSSMPVYGSVIESRINGEFTGWDGETLFLLTNGQIWQQTSYAYTYHYSYFPEVLIYRSGAGWRMSVAGVASTIAVMRLR